MSEAYIIDGVRTPIGSFGGSLAETRPDDMAALTIKRLLEQHSALDPARITDVIMGCANQAGEDNRNVARMSLLLAGLPVSVPGETVNRLCASGMTASLPRMLCASMTFHISPVMNVMKSTMRPDSTNAHLLCVPGSATSTRASP